MSTGVFVISKNGHYRASEYMFYSQHGEFHGKTEVMCYTNITDARKFYSHEDAHAHLTHQFPLWARDKHEVVEISDFDFFRYCPREYVKIAADNHNKTSASQGGNEC